jgi:hypothetical protein
MTAAAAALASAAETAVAASLPAAAVAAARVLRPVASVSARSAAAAAGESRRPPSLARFFLSFFFVCVLPLSLTHNTDAPFAYFLKGIRSRLLSGRSSSVSHAVPLSPRDKMEDDPFLVPSERGEAQERRNEGGDEGSNGSNSDGVLVSPSSSPEPQAALPPLRPSSYRVRGSVFAGRGLYRIDTHRAEDLTPELLKEVRRSWLGRGRVFHFFPLDVTRAQK